MNGMSTFLKPWQGILLLEGWTFSFVQLVLPFVSSLLLFYVQANVMCNECLILRETKEKENQEAQKEAWGMDEIPRVRYKNLLQVEDLGLRGSGG